MRSCQGFTFSTRIQDGIPRDNQRDKKQNVWHVEKPERVFIAFYEILSGPHFFHQDPWWDPKGQPKQQKREMSGRQKNLNIVYWILRGPFKTSLFPTRIQDGIPRDDQTDEQKNVWRVEKPKRLFIEFYEVLSGLHFFHQDPGWDPKGQPKGQQVKRLTCRKTPASFYWIL